MKTSNNKKIITILPIEYMFSLSTHSIAQHSTQCVWKVKWNGKKCEKKIQLAHTMCVCVCTLCMYHNKYNIKTYIFAYTHRFSSFVLVVGMLGKGTCYVPLNSIHTVCIVYARTYTCECECECEYKCLCLLLLLLLFVYCASVWLQWLSTARVSTNLYFRMI